MRDLRAVDADFARTGANQNTLRQQVAVPATTLFNCLADGPAWNEWLGIDVEWTSPKPFGVGTTRTITANRQTIEELFLEWDDGERMNFRFERCTLPVAAFAEDYRIEPRGDSNCELVWSYAYEWGGPLSAIAAKLFGIGFAFNARRSLKKLQALLESNPQRFADRATDG